MQQRSRTLFGTSSEPSVRRVRCNARCVRLVLTPPDRRRQRTEARATRQASEARATRQASLPVLAARLASSLLPENGGKSDEASLAASTGSGSKKKRKKRKYVERQSVVAAYHSRYVIVARASSYICSRSFVHRSHTTPPLAVYDCRRSCQTQRVLDRADHRDTSVLPSTLGAESHQGTLACLHHSCSFRC